MLRVAVLRCWLRYLRFYKVAPRYGDKRDLRRLFAEAKKRACACVWTWSPGIHPWNARGSSSPPARTERVFRCGTSGTQPFNFFSGRLALPIYRPEPRTHGRLPDNFSLPTGAHYGFANPDPDQPWPHAVTRPDQKPCAPSWRKIMKFWLDLGAEAFPRRHGSLIGDRRPRFGGDDPVVARDPRLARPGVP